MFRKLISLAFFVLIVGVGGYLWLDNGHRTENMTAVTQIDGIKDVQATDAPLVDVIDPTIGAEDAPVTIMEYASFTCPHCARFHETVYGKLKAEYIDTGKVRFIMRDVYFDRFGLWAALLARCEPKKFFGISDLVYSRQKEWATGDSPAVIVDNLRKLGALAGLSSDQMDTCLTDNDKARALVAAYQKNANKDDITGTPTFIINGTKYPNMSYEDFKTTIDGMLAKN